MRGIWRSSEERGRLVEAYRKSGVSVDAFAAREGIGASTFYGWLRAPQLAPRSATRIARVVVARTKTPLSEDEAPVLLEYAGARMSVRRGFDRRVLAEVLSVLEQHR